MHIRLIGLASVLFASAAFAADKEVTVNVENTPGMKLTVPEEGKAETKGDNTAIQIKKLRFHVWPVSKAKTVEDALPNVADVIKGEFKDFAVTSTEDTTIAGNPAKHLKGKGVEADDNDPSVGDVVVFTVGNRVFVACASWEEDEERADERKTFLEVLKSAKAP
jgi:hypothetical protein